MSCWSTASRSAASANFSMKPISFSARNGTASNGAASKQRMAERVFIGRFGDQSIAAGISKESCVSFFRRVQFADGRAMRLAQDEDRELRNLAQFVRPQHLEIEPAAR